MADKKVQPAPYPHNQIYTDVPIENHHNLFTLGLVYRLWMNFVFHTSKLTLNTNPTLTLIIQQVAVYKALYRFRFLARDHILIPYTKNQWVSKSSLQAQYH